MPGEATLRLAPASERGWFGGRCLDARGTLDVRSGLTVAQAAETLEAAFEGRGAPIAAALVGYEGEAVVATWGGFERRRGAGGSADGGSSGRGPLIAPARIMDAADFRAGVEEVRRRIAEGDVYVLNLTHTVTGRGVLTPEDAHRTLLDRARSDMSALFAWPGGAVASASPERFLRVRAGAGGVREVEVHPIKGTRPRGATPDADAAMASELLSDPKERAEHVMVVDLERNDLGRVCETGTVTVDPLYEVVATPYCHQLVSRVRGVLRPGMTFAELLEAAFPCGSVTGAPKVAAMRIAAELEASPRGAYCGSLMVAVPGELDSSVLIRTLEYRGGARAGSGVAWGAGCGITHDSLPAAEWLESLLKASPALGDGLPEVALRETARVAAGAVPLLDHHLARLASGGCGPTVLAKVREAVAGALERWGTRGPGRLSVTVTPDGEALAGVSGEPSSLAVEGGPRLVAVEVAGPPGLPLGAAKPAARRAWDRAHRAARLKGGDQAMLVGPGGAVIDGSTASVWIREGRRLLTPPAPPAVAGVMRAVVFDLAPGCGFGARAEPLTAARVWAADEVFLTNAYGGIVPVRERDGEARRALSRAAADRLGFR